MNMTSQVEMLSLSLHPSATVAIRSWGLKAGEGQRPGQMGDNQGSQASGGELMCITGLPQSAGHAPGKQSLFSRPRLTSPPLQVLKYASLVSA